MNEFGLTRPVMTTTVLQHHEYADDFKTGVVLGIGQGGTSMVAAVLDGLGLPATDDGHIGNFANPTRPNPPDDWGTWKQKVQALNAGGKPWCFKDPAIFRFPIHYVLGWLVNPYFVVITRDPIAVLQRRREGENEIRGEDVLETLMRVNDEYSQAWDWIFQLTLRAAPILLVSYQRAIANREQFVDDVIAFMRLDVTPEVRQKTIERISPTGGYLEREE